MMRKLRAIIGAPLLVRGVADLGAVCRHAIVASNARDVRTRVDYLPQHRGDGTGYWDSSRLARAVSLLLEDAAASVAGDDRVELRWRTQGDEAVIRVQYPRALEPGDRLVTFFDEPREDHAPGAAGAQLREARDIVLRHGGTLARVRTRSGTTYVVSLPRDRSRVASDSAVSPVDREAALAP
jgi:signal transduction histidine kinase